MTLKDKNLHRFRHKVYFVLQQTWYGLFALPGRGGEGVGWRGGNSADVKSRPSCREAKYVTGSLLKSGVCGSD